MTAETRCCHDAWNGRQFATNVKDRHEAEADDDDDDDDVSHRSAPSVDGHDNECPDSPSATTEIRCSSSERPAKQTFDPEFKEDPTFQRRLSDPRTPLIPPSVLLDFQEPRMPVPVQATAPLAIGGSHLMAVIMAKGRGPNQSFARTKN